MLTYLLYATLKIVFRITNITNTNTGGRIFDILSLILSVSNMLMLYGVSDSIKKSVER